MRTTPHWYATMAGAEPEGHHVGQAVVLLAEGALGAGGSRDAPIEGVEDHRDEHGDAGGGEVVIDGGDDGVEPGEQAPGGHQVRQQVDASAPREPGVLSSVVHRPNVKLFA